jgi:hypothetical protein
MPWTYSGDPTSSAKDEVRYLTGDTDVTKPWTLQDAEIQYSIGLYSSNPPVIGHNFYAAAMSAERILGKLRRDGVSAKSVGDLHISYLSELALVQGTIKALWRSANLQGVPVTMGGQSLTDKAAQDADPDRVRPALTIGGMNKIGDADASMADVQLP